MQYQQLKVEKGNRNYEKHKSGFAWEMENIGSPGIIDLFLGLESRGI